MNEELDQSHELMQDNKIIYSAINRDILSTTICLALSTQYRRVPDKQTDGRTDILRQHSPRYA